MGEHAHVQLIGDINGRYVVAERRPGGELTLAPDTSWSAIVERSGGRELTPDESAEFQRDYASLMLPPRRRAVGVARPQARSFPAHFDPDGWEEDLTRTTPAGREVAEAARRAYERDGIPVEHLRRVEGEGRDGTVLPDCAKVYLPQPVGRFGMVFRAIRSTVGCIWPTLRSACVTRPRTRVARPSINWLTSAYTVSRRDRHRWPEGERFGPSAPRLVWPFDLGSEVGDGRVERV